MTSEMITSSQNQYVQLARAVATQAKARRKERAFLAEGARLVEDGLRSGFAPRFIAFKEGLSQRARETVQLAHHLNQKTAQESSRISGRQAKLAYPVLQFDAALFDGLTDTEASQGVMAVFDIPELPLPEPLNFVLVLDQVRDPGNLGTILRSAEAAGVQAVFLLPCTADPWAPKVVRSAMGSHFRLPVFTCSVEALETILTDMNVFYADMDGEISYWLADFKAKTALLIGGEAEGASPAGLHLASTSIRIPMAGRTESLNAAVSAALLMFEVSRQRQ